MKALLATAALAAFAAATAAPAPAYAAKDFSFDQTKGRLVTLRNKLVQECQRTGYLDARTKALAERDGYSRVCGQYWNGQTIGQNGQEAKILYQVTRDPVMMQTVEAWVFRFQMHATTGAFADAVVIDVTTHTDNTMSMGDDQPRSTGMEVVYYPTPEGKNPQPFTYGGMAWTGRSISGAATKRGKDVPSVSFDSPLYKVIHNVKDLKRWVNNEFYGR